MRKHHNGFHCTFEGRLVTDREIIYVEAVFFFFFFFFFCF